MRIRVLTAIFIVAAASAASAETITNSTEGSPSITAVQIIGSGYRLLRDCAPFFINGVYGSERLDELRQAGGNCVLAQDLSRAGEILEAAQRAGVTVAVALQLQQGGSVAYTNPASVATAIQELRPEIQELKNHPALLLWIIRSDIANGEQTNAVAYRSVNALAKLLHADDPDHPVAVDLGVLDNQSPKPKLLATLCPEVDVLGWIPAAEYTNVVSYIRESGWLKPYIIMQIGAPRPGTQETTPWLSPIEPLSAAKVSWCVDMYSHLVSVADGLCLGSFAYSWDAASLVTPTWFTLNQGDRGRAEVVDALTFSWTGAWPTNRAPEVLSITSTVSCRLTAAGSRQDAAVTASDPESDDLTYEWVMLHEIDDGDYERLISTRYETITGAIAQVNQAKTEFTVPAKAGPYRLIVYVRDDKGHVASANVPFLVEATREPVVVTQPPPREPEERVSTEETALSTGAVSRVDVRHSMDGGWQLYVNDRPFFVKGAGGKSHLDELKAAGANSIRTWSTDYAGKILDDAHQRGLMVCLGLWMQQERHRFDYNDRDAVERQLKKLRAAVNKYKNHPALLMWCCGIEVEWGAGTNAAVYRAINEVARMVHEEDPYHPTTTAFADIGKNSCKAALAARYCPELDILGINSYGGLPSMADRLRDVGWVRPYMIMEFGPKGQWEVEQTPWGAEIEQMPLEKASFYLESYLKSVSGQENWCLGSFVFSWDSKFECTPTWYSMHLIDGLKVNTVDTMWSAWSKAVPTNRCPQITKIESPLKHVKVAPAKNIELTVMAVDPDGDPMQYEWVLMSEHKSKGSDGMITTSLKPIGGRIKDPKAAATQIQTPTAVGAYRVFCYVRDGRGGASSANMPFYVQSP